MYVLYAPKQGRYVKEPGAFCVTVTESIEDAHPFETMGDAERARSDAAPFWALEIVEIEKAWSRVTHEARQAVRRFYGLEDDQLNPTREP